MASGGCSLAVVHRLLCGSFSCWAAQALGWVGFIHCGSQALSMASVVMAHKFTCLKAWDLPGPGMEPVSPGLAGGILIPEPLGKPEQQSLHNDFENI